MKKVCAWCGKDLGVVETNFDSQHDVSHGICEQCAFHLFAQLGMPLQEYLDGLGDPILVVNGDVNVKTANRRARELLQKELPAIEGYKGGDVFECEYARLPEGCGKTAHCSACAIRRTVTDTFKTGITHVKVPACLHRMEGAGNREIHLLISTELVNGVVLLRVDRVCDSTSAAHGSKNPAPS